MTNKTLFPSEKFGFGKKTLCKLNSCYQEIQRQYGRRQYESGEEWQLPITWIHLGFFFPRSLKCYEILPLPWGNPICSFLVFSHLPRSQNDSSLLSIRVPDLCISRHNPIVFPLFQSLLYYFHKIQFCLYFWEAENSDPGASSKVLEDSERFIGTYLYPRDVTSRLFLTAGMQHS